jgi:hypothetical protein
MRFSSGFAIGLFAVLDSGNPEPTPSGLLPSVTNGVKLYFHLTMERLI